MPIADPPQLFLVPSFHHEAAALHVYGESLQLGFRILDEALRLLGQHPEYRFLVEQTLLLEDYVRRFPAQRAAMRQLAQDRRLEVGPGFYVTPDMNQPNGESLFLQAKYGKQWTRDVLGVDPRVCWIADACGHPAQLPQILKLCGYDYYIFQRCMRRDVMRNEFWWQGLDGTKIKAHWLAPASANRSSCDYASTLVAGTPNLIPAAASAIGDLATALGQYGPGEALLLNHTHAAARALASAPELVKQLKTETDLPIRFATPTEYLDTIAWDQQPTHAGEFNSALPGTFTTHIRLKRANRRLTARLSALGKFLVVGAHQRWDLSDLWKLALKQQAYRVIGGAIADAVVKESIQETDLAEQSIDGIWQELERGLEPKRITVAVFNPLSFARTEAIDYGGKRMLISLPPLGLVAVDQAKSMAPTAAVTLPVSFENRFYTATVDQNAFITQLTDRASGRQIVRPHPSPFGGLALQLDYGDPWLNFESPFDERGLESSLEQNTRDPYSRAVPGEMVNRGTFSPTNIKAHVVRSSPDELVVEQSGTLRFERLAVNFTTRVHLVAHSPRITYETTLYPTGKHYRIRVAFPTTIGGETDPGVIRHEIQFGIQQRAAGEHVAQTWMDYADTAGGLALLNTGTPASNTDDGVMMLTLFRSVAMEYKTESTLAFGDGVPHIFRYAIVPHGSLNAPAELVSIIREGHALNAPPVICKVDTAALAGDGWEIDLPNIVLSSLRYSGTNVFVRLYDSTGQGGSGVLTIPRHFTTCADADGLERAAGPFRRCDAKIAFTLRPFEIRGWLLGGEA